MKKVKWLVLMVVVVALFATSGCMSLKNDIKSRGGLLGSHSGDYVVLSQSGGLIMDCWLLQNVYVESVSESDGWRFVDDSDNSIYIGGDVKVIRCEENSDLFNKYYEYHMEFESSTYREKFN